MARKSNKTAHVLNLLSGQDAGDEAEKETQAQKSDDTAAPASTPKPAAASTAEEPTGGTQSEVPAHISIIDNGPAESDPVAEQIRDELLKSLEPETAPIPEAKPEPENEPKPVAATNSMLETAPQTTPEEPASSITQEELKKSEESFQTVKKEEPEEEILDLAPSTPEEPEPDYVMVNVMQRIVEDKIIYFMKQFEVCTCSRCKADTIALTLTGLPAKYMVMDKYAVDPMISFLTSRLISQVTVEALKACTQVKENPRH